MSGGVLSVYRALTSVASPCVFFHLLWRRLRGLEHHLHIPERMGRTSIVRPSGPLLWFHAVSVGEAMSAIPIIKHCILMRPSLNILLTTSTVTSYLLLQQTLPAGVLCQFAPIDTPDATENFLTHWHPDAGIFIESELWPNLLSSAFHKGVKLALINARMSSRSYNRWLLPVARHLIMDLLSVFRLIVPLSTEEATRYQILGAPPTTVHFAGNLKYVVDAVNSHDGKKVSISKLRADLGERSVWIAASTHPGEEHVIASIHMCLRLSLPNLITIIAPRHPERGTSIALEIQQRGLEVAVRSQGDHIHTTTDIYIADTIGELKNLYRVSEVAFIGGSLIKGMMGHNLAEAAAAGCAVLTGPYIGHFSQMVSDFHQVARDSIWQVAGKDDLQNRLHLLFTNHNTLQSCRAAALHASELCAQGVILRVWRHLELFLLQEAFGSEGDHVQFPMYAGISAIDSDRGYI
ncbi:hypothetical protein KP509_01G024500 [Ceratopteris richardii]|uniref:lipid IVA 3-deoxy-D-manno-octulosonic acid transferase n=1 Tax=Ceratopteris richardii TaxID=49495 RepID=A0A8T2VFD6_CERRI|nr:hypothetical protein KP509_01G024500 [Ceratopteris richardii]